MADVIIALGPIALTTTMTDVHVVTTGKTFVIKNLAVCNEDGTANHTFTVSIGADGTNKRRWKNKKVYSEDAFLFDGWLAVPSATHIQAGADANSVLTLFISGVEQ